MSKETDTQRSDDFSKVSLLGTDNVGQLSFQVHDLLTQGLTAVFWKGRLICESVLKSKPIRAGERVLGRCIGSQKYQP